MKTEVYIYNLNGNRAAVRDYANAIASMNATSSNAYVMAFDKNNEILWTVQADNLDSVNEVINWQGVRRVEIYDHSADGAYKFEYVYITSRKSLNEYTSERNASEFVVVGNTTQYTADNWQKAEAEESDNSDDNSDGNSEGKQTAAEPSAIAQAAAKVKAYARRAAFDMSLFAVVVLCFVFFFACIHSLNMMLQAAGFEGTACTVLTFFALLPAMDVTLWLECNALAVLARLFPGSFVGSSRPEFLRPCSIFAKMYRNL